MSNNSPKKRHSDPNNNHHHGNHSPPKSAPGRMKQSKSKRTLSIEDVVAEPPLGRRGSSSREMKQRHSSSKRHSDTKKRMPDDNELHWTELSSSKRKLKETSRRSSRKFLETDIISDEEIDINDIEVPIKSGSSSRSPHHNSKRDEDGSRRRSSRKLSPSPSKSPSRRRSSRKLSPSPSPSRSNRGSRRDLLERSKSPSRSNRGSRRDVRERSKSPSRRGSKSRRDLMDRSKSPSRRGSSRRDMMEKSPSRSNRGNRRDLMDRSKSPSRRGSSRRDMMEKSPSRSNRGNRRDLMDRSKSPSRRSSRHLESTRTSKNARPSLEDRAAMILNDDIPRLIINQNNEESNGELGKRKFLVGVIICLMLLLGIASGAAWFLLTQGNDEEDTTEAPSTSPSSPSERPTLMPSSLPTGVPTPIPQVFDPPSEQDCFNIRTRQPVDGQEDMIPTPFGLDFDVSVRPGTDTAFWAATFLDAFMRNLIPDLTGCTRFSRRDLAESRQLVNSEFRYAIGNVNATAELQLDKSCEGDAPQPCYRFVVKMDLYLKDVLSNFQLISLVVGIVNPPPDSEETMVQRLRLPSSVFEQVSVVLIGSTTESPTMNPSQSPSVYPSMVPSTMPSSSPTPKPTPSPTQSPTKEPSSVPTRMPSKSPSSRPSASPSRRPSMVPSLRPSMVPSLRPSQQPSVSLAPSESQLPTS